MTGNKKALADLHLHTMYSDSTYTPKQLVDAACASGLSCIAVTDHDTIDGVVPCMEQVKGRDLEILPGIELTAEESGLEVHVLGYLIDPGDQKLVETMENLKKYRIQRIYKMVDKLKALGLEIEAQSIFKLAGDSSCVSRLHLARTMLQEGLISSISEAFQRFIGDRGPAYVAGFPVSVKEAIELIKDAKGIPVLAHPYSLGGDGLIIKFIGYGLMGLEAYYPEHTKSKVNFYLKLAKKYKLLVTGGSDCHGDAKPEIRLGLYRVPYELVSELKKAKG